MLGYKYRIYPSGKQVFRLNRQMQLAKELYNLLFEKSKSYYKETGKTLSEIDMNKHIIQLKREQPQFQELYSQVAQNVSKRLGDSYKAFFRRVKGKKAGKRIKVGFPRIKKHACSLTYPQSGFKFKNSKRLHLSNIGNIPIVMHRPPKGTIKTCVIKQYPSRKWYVGFSNEVPEKAFESNNKEAIGIDVGLTSFATLSNGEKINPPKFLRKSEKRLKLLSRRVSRKKPNSRNRRRARRRKARLEERIVNQKFDFLHKLSRKQVNSYGKIAVEKLKVKNMVKNHCLAKSISDAGWSTYRGMLAYKARSAGCELIEVNPENTSRECNKCGHVQEMPLGVRTYKCLNCGYSEDRDVNAAMNILKRATAGLAESHACGDMPSVVSAMKLQDISLKQELNALK